MPSIPAILVQYLLIALSAQNQPTASTPQPPDPVDGLVLQEMSRQHIPGLSLAVIKDGQPLKTKGYGLANVELNVPATADTVYQIQSVTKSFTATAIMMLVEEGKIDLAAKVSQYLDDTPDSWKDITIRHLLSHTSGIKDFINEPTASLRLDVTEEEVFKVTAARPLNFQPGEKYAYCNTNYHLLAMIIRKLTGQYYGDFLRDRIFKPLDMTHTAIISLSDIIPNRASGYRWERGALHNGDYIAQSVLSYAGGGIRSTVADMVKWDAALYTEKLVKKSSLEQMWSQTKLNDGRMSDYGFGWATHPVNGHRWIGHSGSHMTGFETVIHRYPNDGLTVVVFSNLRGANVDAIARKVAGHYLPAVGLTTRPAN